jgi:hypothetical protein
VSEDRTPDRTFWLTAMFATPSNLSQQSFTTP